MQKISRIMLYKFVAADPRDTKIGAKKKKKLK